MRGLGKFRPLIAFLRLMGREKWARALGFYCYCCSRRGLIHIAILAIFQIGEAGREGVHGGVRGNKKLGYRLIEARLQLEGGAKSRAVELKLVRFAKQDSLILAQNRNTFVNN